MTLTQIGYGAGLLLVVPLSDLFENRRLIVVMISLAAIGLLCSALSPNAVLFLAAALLVGVGSAAMQVVVPYSAHITPEAERGRVVGFVMSGLLLGMMLARPVASAIAQFASWRVVFGLAALGMVLLAILVERLLPVRRPTGGARYGSLLRSMGKLVLTTPTLRRRSIYHACLFAAFSLFWTTTPLLLTGPIFQMSQGGLALFALAGAAGVIAAPIAGRVADRGWTRPATTIAMVAVAGAFMITHVDMSGSILSLALLLAAALIVDFSVSAHMIISQRIIFSLNPEYRGRLNGIYIATIFFGGAVGSALGGWAYSEGGWLYASIIGFCFPMIAALYFNSERHSAR